MVYPAHFQSEVRKYQTIAILYGSIEKRSIQWYTPQKSHSKSVKDINKKTHGKQLYQLCFHGFFPLKDCSFAHVRRPGLSYPPRPDSDSQKGIGCVKVPDPAAGHAGFDVFVGEPTGQQDLNKHTHYTYTNNIKMIYNYIYMWWSDMCLALDLQNIHTIYIYICVKDWKGNVIKWWFLWTLDVSSQQFMGCPGRW